MRNNHRWFYACLCILLGIMAALVLLVLSNYGAYAEAIPSPNVKDHLRLDGDLRLSDAPMDLYVAECLRVDVVGVSADGACAELKLPYVPPNIWGVALFDGYHMIHGVWTQAGDTLKIFFWPEDLIRLDGTVGIYLVILAVG